MPSEVSYRKDGYTADQSARWGAWSVAGNSVELNPQRRNNFTLVIHGIDNLPRTDSVDETIGPGSVSRIPKNIGTHDVEIALLSCDVPSYTQSTVEISRGNSKVKYAGRPTFGSISISAYNYIGSQAADTLLAWEAQCYNPTYDYVGHVGKNNNGYKKSCELVEQTPEGQTVRYWEIKGAWIHDVKFEGFDASNDSIQTISATIEMDRFAFHLPDDADYDDRRGF